VPGNTEYERFHNAMRKIVSVPKEAVQKADAEWKAERMRKKRAKKEN
jgi:hypothetical protein